MCRFPVNPWEEQIENPAPEGRITLAQRFRVCVRAPSGIGAVGQRSSFTSPGGANNLSPALQRWGEWEFRLKSRRDDPVLTHTRESWKKMDA